MKVLHVASNIDPLAGGPSAVVLGMLRAQKKAGLDVSLAFTFPSGCSPAASAELGALNIPVHPIGPCGGKINRHPQIRPVLRQAIGATDVVHIHGMWEQIQFDASNLSAQQKVPYVITPHGMLDPWSLSHNRLVKLIYLKLRMKRRLNLAAAIHYTARIEADLCTSLGIKASSIIEPLGIELSGFDLLPMGRDTTREELGLMGQKVIVFLGRLFPGKGIDRLIMVLAKLPPTVSLLVVGPDANGYRCELEVLASSSGVEQRVIFTGALAGSKKLAALQAADLFCLPSDHENFGLAVVESLAVGTPVVISDQVAIHHEIEQAKVGAVVRNDIGQLASVLRRWLDDDALRKAASARALVFSRQTYDWNRIAERWAGHYERIHSAYNSDRVFV